MLIQIDERSGDALFEQIAAQVRRGIAEGTLVAGDRLAPARELGAALGVNMHTVLRAYSLLSDEGLVEMRRSRGVVVTGAAPATAGVVERARALVDEARRHGLRDDEIRRIVEGQL